jgi:hypothetical protein
MKRIAWTIVSIIVCILVSVAFVAFLVNSYQRSYQRNKAKEEAERLEAKRKEQAIITAVREMLAKHNAIDVTFFIGNLEEVSTLDEQNYILRIGPDFLPNLILDYSPPSTDQLRLELECSKPMVDSFLKENPNVLSPPCIFDNRVAVIAKISKVETRFVLSVVGTKEEIKIGKGRCLDLLYVWRVRF